MSLRYEVRPWLSSGTFLEVLKRLSISPDEVTNATIEVDVYTAGYWNILTTPHIALIVAYADSRCEAGSEPVQPV